HLRQEVVAAVGVLDVQPVLVAVQVEDRRRGGQAAGASVVRRIRGLPGSVFSDRRGWATRRTAPAPAAPPPWRCRCCRWSCHGTASASTSLRLYRNQDPAKRPGPRSLVGGMRQRGAKGPDARLTAAGSPRHPFSGTCAPDHLAG